MQIANDRRGSLDGVTPAAVAAVKAYFARGFRVVLGPYRTEQNEQGYTDIVCNYCGAQRSMGEGYVNHKTGCTEYGEIPRARRRRTVSVQRIITYPLSAEIDDNGIVIMP